jgi:signal transduction histidine kinase
MDSLRKGSPCDIPMILGKKMELYGAMGQAQLLNATLKETLKIADSCGIFKYRMYAYQTAYIGFERMQHYKEALACLIIHDSLASVYDNANHLSKVSELDKKYQTKLKDMMIEDQDRRARILLIFTVVLSMALLTLGTVAYMLRKQKAIIAKQNVFNQNLISLISHEVKEPLLGVHFMLKKMKTNDVFLQQISNGLAKQIESVNQILNSLLKLRQSKQDETSKNILALIHACIHELQEHIERKGMTIRIDIKENTTLPLSPEKSKIVLFNLLKNAIKYSFEKGEIHVYQQDRHICIQDFGEGISAEKLDALFHKTVSSTAGTNGEEGHGVGLFLIGQLLEGTGVKVALLPQERGIIAKVIVA